MPRDSIQIPLKDKIITLIFDEFEDEIDLDRLTFIDYANIKAEFLTISTLYNRVGIWKAEAEAKLDRHRLRLKVLEAEKAEMYEEKLKRVGTYANGNEKIEWPTKDQVKNAVSLDKEVRLSRKKEVRLKKDFNIMDSLFWSVKSKEKKLDKLIEGSSIKPEDFEHEIVEGRWNGILIKCQEKLIKG